MRIILIIIMWIIIYSHNRIIISITERRQERDRERGIDRQTERQADRRTERGSIIRGSVSLSADLGLIYDDLMHDLYTKMKLKLASRPQEVLHLVWICWIHSFSGRKVHTGRESVTEPKWQSTVPPLCTS